MLRPIQKACLLLALPVFCITFISFSTHTFTGASALTRYWQDTVPSKKPGETVPGKDIDAHLQQLDQAIEKLEQQLDQKNWNKMQADMQAALGKIDMEKIQQQIDYAMKRVDLQKVQLEAQDALRKIDFEKMQQTLQQSLDGMKDTTNWREMKREIEHAMKDAQKSIDEAKKINFEKLKADMQRTKVQWDQQRLKLEEQLQVTREQLSQNKLNMRQELEKAKVDVQKAKAGLQSYKTGISELEKNGLLNSREDYTIDFRNKELFLNGVKQSQETYDRYIPYFKKDNLTIKKEKGSFSIDNGQ